MHGPMNVKLLNNIKSRYLLTNFTHTKISLEMWTETHVRPQVKRGLLYANFHKTHDYSIQFGNIELEIFLSRERNISSSIKI